jgi:predicted branched-subunit amino acid permease
MSVETARPPSLARAFVHSIPVLLGYVPIGIAFGLLLTDSGYPWALAPLMSVVMYAGAAQFIAIGLFASGAGLWESALITLVVNARHIAYGLSMLKRFDVPGWMKHYLRYSLTDETFALLSALPAAPDQHAAAGQPAAADQTAAAAPDPKAQARFMFQVALLNQSYWVLGSIIGAVAGTFLPIKVQGLGFALTALFLVLMVEQWLKLKRPLPFILSAAVALGASFLLPSRISLLSALCATLALMGFFDSRQHAQDGGPC